MKKILAILMSLVLVFSMVACGNKTKKVEHKDIKVEVSKTKEARVANSLTVNNLDIKKTDSSAKINIKLKEGFLSLLPNLPFNDKETVEKILRDTVSKLSYSMDSFKDLGSELSSTLLKYDGKDVLGLNIKYDSTKNILFFPNLIDKNFVLNYFELSNTENKVSLNQSKVMNTVARSFSENEKIKESLRKVLKDFSGSLEKVLTEKKLVSEPKNVDLQTKSSKIKTTEYDFNVEISKLPEYAYILLSDLQNKPEFEKNLLAFVDTFKSEFEKNDLYKDFYEDPSKTSLENYNKDIENIKKELHSFLSDKDTVKKLLNDDFAKNPILNGLGIMKISLFIDEGDILRSLSFVLDNQIYELDTTVVVDAINSDAKPIDVKLAKEDVVIKKQSDLIALKPEITNGLVKMFESEGIKSLINDLKKGSESLKGQDKAIFDAIINNLNSETIKSSLSR